MSARVTGWVADTGWLLSFGALPQGAGLLRSMFDGGLAVSPAVRNELDVIARGNQRPKGERDAAAKYQGRRRDVLLDVAFEHVDVPERDFAQSHLTARTVPAAGEAAAPLEPPIPEGKPEATSGAHAGESESIAICIRSGLPLLMNDPSATPYARARGVNPENAAVSLLRLTGTKTTHELYALYRAMEKITKSGVTVPGQAWFRQPMPTTTAK